MSFEVLARKYRPQTFDEIVGQDHITLTLKKAVQSGRISHAYLFSGPRGCGKTSTARILAKVINCSSLKDGNPCDACPACLGVIKGRNLDVMEIDGATHTGVAEVRDLQESIGYAPSQHKNKVYIIDEVHMLSVNAFNALLKTLEEPPKHVYFIFATTAPHKIPETIKSRCQRHHFKRLEIREITRQLERICQAEDVKYDKHALRLLARKAEGSMRDGESLLDQCITASSGEVLTDSVRNILGLLDQDMVFSFLETMARKDPTEVLKLLHKVVDEGVDLQELLVALLEGFRDLMVLSTPADLSDLVFRSSDEIEQLEKLLSVYELPDLVTVVERLCNLGPRMKLASDPRILLESSLIDIALLDRQTDIRSLMKKIEGAGGGGSVPGKAIEKQKPLASKKEEKTAPARGSGYARLAPDFTEKVFPASSEKTERVGDLGTQPTVDSKNTDFKKLKQMWDGFVTGVRQKRTSLGISLISGQLAGADDEKVYLRFPKSSFLQKCKIEEPSNRQFLKRMIMKAFGREVELVCLGEGEGRHGESGLEKENAGPRETLENIEHIPLARKILEDFDGEIIQY